MNDAALVPGQVIAGKFQIERVLGKGGMGMVVAARHLHLEERVAIKVLLPEMVNGEIVARFLREARAAVRIRSEHVAKVSDVGALEDGAPYMVMEYLEGRDLSQLLSARGALTVDEVVEYVLQACAALAEAHALGIVHRDLKPANLFLTHRVDGSPCVKVLDFGISKLVSQAPREDAALTKTGGMLGSPLYMSPEQLTSARQVDARSDLWSLGVIMYELLSGTVPFTGEELPHVIVNVLQGDVRPLTDCMLPGGLEAVVMRCLARDREQRVQSVLELAEALAPFASPRALRPLDAIRAVSGVAPTYAVSQPAISRPSTPTAQQTTAPSVADAAPNATTVPSQRRAIPLWLVPLVAAIVLAAAFGAVMVVRNLGPHAAAPPPTESVAPSPEPPPPEKSAPEPASPPMAAVSASTSAKPAPTSKPRPKPVQAKPGPGVIDDPL